MDEHYVYAHVGHTTMEVFYIGAGKKRRCYDKRHNQDWIDRLDGEGGRDVIFLKSNLSKSDAMALKQKIIDIYGLDRLTNITSNRGNITSFKKGLVPWNKGLKNCQKHNTKAVRFSGEVYKSVEECITKLEIGKTTFYRWVKKGKIDYV